MLWIKVASSMVPSAHHPALVLTQLGIIPESDSDSWPVTANACLRNLDNVILNQKLDALDKGGIIYGTVCPPSSIIFNPARN